MNTTAPYMKNSVALRDIWKARHRIATIIRRTPLVYSPSLSDLTGSSVYLKLENLQDTGAFKIRGAANKILSLSPEEQRLGVTTFSTGNHGLAVAYVARQLGIKAVICVSKRVPKAKTEPILRLGAELEVYGESQDDAEKRCYQLEQERKLSVIKPFDDPHVIAGQGTIGLELLEDLPDIDMVIAGLSGGGLHAGIGLAMKSTDPGIRVVGASMEHSAVMHASLKAGRPVALEERDTLADSLLGGIGLDNKYTFQMVRNVVDDAVLVPEEAIAEAMAHLYEKHHLAVEGAAATGVAALLSGRIANPGSHIAIVISGCNVNAASHFQAIRPYITR